jgi:cystathionine beta-synthase
VGVGTGGTISGTAKFLKEKNPKINIWGIDTYGSVFKKYHETGEFDEDEIYPYITEGIGEDILPKNVDFTLIDHFEKVSDKDGAIFARKLAREEGLLLGYSAGSAIAGLLQLKNKLSQDDVVVVIFHDHGSRYVGKIFNDDWMRDRGFLDKEVSVENLIEIKKSEDFISIEPTAKIREALLLMQDKDISQLPVVIDNKIIGSVTERGVVHFLLGNNGDSENIEINEIMGDPFPEVDLNLPINELNRYITKEIPAVITSDKLGNKYILTQYDIIQAL